MANSFQLANLFRLENPSAKATNGNFSSHVATTCANSGMKYDAHMIFDCFDAGATKSGNSLRLLDYDDDNNDDDDHNDDDDDKDEVLCKFKIKVRNILAIPNETRSIKNYKL